MNFHPFPALLRSSYNMVHEYGTATISPNGQEIDFTGDFVPLIPLDTQASILWVLGDKVVGQFNGRVYLSSPHLLRLVDVDSDLLTRARILLVTNTEIAARFTIGKKDNGSSKLIREPADIIFLSMEQMSLRTQKEVPVGKNLFLSAQADFLTLHNLGLKVREQVPLKKDEHLLLCSVESGGNDNFIALSAYAAKLSLQSQQEEEIP